jgi:hypothetical protein
MTDIQDTIGVIRDHRWVRAREQKRRLDESGARIIVELDGQGKVARQVTMDALARLTREGTVLKLVHAFFLADPKALRKRGGTKANFDATLKLLTEKRGGIVMDLETGLTTERPEHRKALVALSYAHIARSNQGLKSALNGERSRGRPRSWDDPAVRQVIWEEWHSSENKTNKQASERAGTRLGKYVSPNTMWRIVNEMRQVKGLKGKGASGRRPNSAAARVAEIGASEPTIGPKAPPPARGVVYFVKNGERDRVKIGFSVRHSVRLSTLQGASPDALTLLGVIPGTMQLERKLHQRFKAYRVKGEWFRVEGELANFLKTLPKISKA